MALMKIGCVQLIVLMFIPLGLSMKCWSEPHVREESAVAICTEMSARTSNTCIWDIVTRRTEHRSVDGSVSFPQLSSSTNDARVLWTCFLRYKLSPSYYYKYYYVYFGESQDRRRLAFGLNIRQSMMSMTCWYMADVRRWSATVVCTEMSARISKICRWEINDRRPYTERMEGTVSFSKLPTSTDDSRFLWNCSVRHKMPSPPPAGSTVNYYYFVYFGESQDSGRIAFTLLLTGPGTLTLNNCPQSVKEGDNVTCECTTQRTGHPPPILSWRGQTTSVLHFTDVRLDKVEATYTCEMIWANRLQTISYSFGGKLVDPGEPILKNCTQHVIDGDNVTCECTTQRTGHPPPILSWRGQTTSVLHFTDVRLGKMEATYTCEMTWRNLLKTVTYSFGGKLVDPGEPILKNCLQSVKDGDNVTCECTTQRTGHPPPILSWGEQTTSVLHFSDVRLDKVQATYTCEMIWENQLKTISYSFGGKLAESPSDQPEDNTGVIAGAAIAGAAVVGLSATSAVLFWKRRKKERLLLEKGKEGESSRQQNDEDLEEETYVEIHDVSDQAALAAGGDVYGYTEIDNGVGSIRQKKPPLPNRGATDTQNMHNGDNPYDQANSSSEDITPGPSAKPSRKTSHKPSSTEAPYEVCRETETTQQRPASSETSSEESPISSSPSSKSNESEGYTYPGSRDSKKHTKYLTPMPSSPGLEKKGSTSLANTDVSYLTPALEGSGASPTTDVTRADNSLSGQEKSQADYYLTPASEKTPADYYLTPVSGEGQGHSTDSTKEDYYLTPRSVEGSMQLASEDAIPAVEYMPVLAPSLLPEELNTEMMKAGYLTPVHIQSSLQTAEAEKDASHSSDSLKKAGYLTPVDVPGSPVTSQMLAKSEPSSGISKTSSYTTPVEVPGSPVTSKSQGKDTQSSDIKKPQDYLTPGSASPPKKEKKKSSMIPLAEFWSSKRLSPNRKSPSSSEGEPEAPHPYEKISSVKHMDPSNDPSYRRIGDVIMTEQTNSDTPNYQNC